MRLFVNEDRTFTWDVGNRKGLWMCASVLVGGGVKWAEGGGGGVGGGGGGGGGEEEEEEN